MGSISVLEPSIKGDDKGEKNGESEREIIKKKEKRRKKEKKKTKKTKKRKKTKKTKKYRIQILSTFPEICSIFLEIWRSSVYVAGLFKPSVVSGQSNLVWTVVFDGVSS